METETRCVQVLPYASKCSPGVLFDHLPGFQRRETWARLHTVGRSIWREKEMGELKPGSCTRSIPKDSCSDWFLQRRLFYNYHWTSRLVSQVLGEKKDINSKYEQ